LWIKNDQYQHTVILLSGLALVSISILNMQKSIRELDTRLNRRIDGFHERLDTIREFIMMRFDNDITELKKNKVN